MPKEELGLKTKKKTLYDNKSNRKHIHHVSKHHSIHLGHKHAAFPNANRLLSRKEINKESEEYSLLPINASYKENSSSSREESSASSVSYQTKAGKRKSELRPEIQESIYGLSKYDAPSIIVTSTVRNWGGKGHRCGKAIDINYSKTVTSWLLSDLGQAWLDEYNLEFFIENFKRSSKEMLSPEEEKHWRWIPWSTGLHCHINLKN